MRGGAVDDLRLAGACLAAPGLVDHLGDAVAGFEVADGDGLAVGAGAGAGLG